jgi:hypothetical protein
MKNTETYTKKFVEKLIRDCIQATQKGMLEWILKDTGIRDIKTKKEINGAELYLLPNSKGKGFGQNLKSEE